MITFRELQVKLRSEPFVPFRLHTSFGEAADVTRPDGAIVLTTRIVVGIPNEPGDPDFDRLKELSIPHICSVEDLPLQ